MSGQIIPTPAYKAAEWYNFTTLVEKQRLGFIALSLTNFDNESEPQIAAGSVVEISGSLFKFDSNDSIGGTPTSDQINYVMLEVSGSGDSQTVSGSWTTTAPTWSDAKQGWYDATGNKRYVAGCYYDGTYYAIKFVLDRGQDVLRKFEFDIGDWNMDTTADKYITHHFGNAYKKIKGTLAMIRDDDDTMRCDIQRVSGTQNTAGSVAFVSSTQICCSRLTGGIFDHSLYDGTGFSRGTVTIEFKVI